MADTIIRQRLEEARRVRAGLPAATEKTPAPDLGTAEVEEKIRQDLVSRVDPQMLGKREDPAVQAKLRQMVADAIDRHAGVIGRVERARLMDRVVSDVFGYGPIQSLIDDPTITEIMVNRWDKVYFEREGQIVLSEITFRDDQHVRTVIEKIVGPIGRRIDESSPMVDARLPDGSRVNAVIPPLALDGACMTIRKFGKGLTVKDLVRVGTLTERDVAFLKSCVEGRLNVVISGGTGSGKTTVLNALSSFVPSKERIVTIEDAAELRLQQEHVVRLEARPPNIEGKGEIPVRALVRNALRMRPDRIIVGEVRGGEALDMLQAMNTGHEGSLTTLHANSSRDALSRLEVMVLMAGEELPHKAIREQIASSVDMVVQVARLREGVRKIVEISEVAGMESGEVVLRPVFVFSRDTGRLEPTGIVPGFLKKMAWYGVSVEEGVFASRAA